MITSTSPKAIKNASGRRIRRTVGTVALGVLGFLNVIPIAASAAPKSFGSARSGDLVGPYVARCVFVAKYRFVTTVTSDDGPILTDFILRAAGGRPDDVFDKMVDYSGVYSSEQESMSGGNQRPAEFAPNVQRPFVLRIAAKVSGRWEDTESPVWLTLSTSSLYEATIAVGIDDYGSVKTAKVSIQVSQAGPAYFRC